MSVAFSPNAWPAEAIWEVIAPLLPDFTVEVLPEIDSTNTELMRRAKSGLVAPTLLVAEKQTAGRGRLGREWHDLAERTEELPTIPALTFSLGLLLSPTDWSGLSLAVGVSIAQSLHASIGLKWPNDLWLQNRKLAGILIETCAVGQLRYVIIGVGINIIQPKIQQPSALPSLRTPPAFLQELTPKISSAEVLLRVSMPLVQSVLRFTELGFVPFQSSFNSLDVLRNRQVCVDNYLDENKNTMSTAGVALGVNTKGELMIQTAHGMQTINSSEVSVKPL